MKKKKTILRLNKTKVIKLNNRDLIYGGTDSAGDTNTINPVKTVTCPGFTDDEECCDY